jgi:hypothetical protein
MSKSASIWRCALDRTITSMSRSPTWVDEHAVAVPIAVAGVAGWGRPRRVPRRTRSQQAAVPGAFWYRYLTSRTALYHSVHVPIVQDGRSSCATPTTSPTDPGPRRCLQLLADGSSWALEPDPGRFEQPGDPPPRVSPHPCFGWSNHRT